MQNNQKWLFAAAAAMLAGSAMADQLTVQEALNRAVGNRLQSLSINGEAPSMKLVYTGKNQNKNCFYVVNNEQEQGFMIISADNLVPAVLGVFEGSVFDYDKLPTQLKAMMTHYENWISGAIANGKAVEDLTPSEASDVDVLCRTVWQQAAPYNNDCKELLDAGLVSAEEKSLTGCVATAFSQCVYYFWDKWNYSANPSGTVTYELDYKNEKGTAGCTPGKVNINTDVTATIDYANMILQYDGFEYTEAQAAAVAQLMHLAGLTLKMNYEDKTGGSGTSDDNIPVAFKDFWGFDEGVKYVERSKKDGNAETPYSDQEWVDLIFGELKGARPVMYGAVGRKSDGTDGGGHEFVIDGFRTSDNLFHVNWGWENGYCNGWCHMTGDLSNVLKPVSETGGSTGTADSTNDPYSNGQGAIIGIMPKGFAEMTAVTPQGSHGIKAVKEGTDYTSTETMEVAGVKYTRSFNGQWQALYVPFDIPAASLSDFEVAEPSTCDGSKLVITPVTDGTKANGIYLIKAKEAGDKTIEVSEKTTLAAAAKATKEISGYTFTGTYTALKGKDWNKDWYALGSGENAGKLIKTNCDPAGNADVELLKQYRWYMAAGGSGARADIQIIEEEATGISNILDATAEQQAFNLSGQRVNADAKGIVIVNGKKVWNK